MNPIKAVFYLLLEEVSEIFLLLRVGFKFQMRVVCFCELNKVLCFYVAKPGFNS